MPWDASNTIPAMKNKSLQLRQVFAKAANAALVKGLSEEDAVFAGLSAVKIEEKKIQKAAPKVEPPKVPQHVLAAIEIAKKAQEENPQVIPEVPVLISAKFNQYNQLVLGFSDGSTIVSNEVQVDELIQNIAINQQVVSEGGGGGTAPDIVDGGTFN